MTQVKALRTTARDAYDTFSEPAVKEAAMTTTELVATLLIWALTACGLFFGLRGMLRRRRRPK